MENHSIAVPSCLIVGAGPGGLAPLLAAAHDGCLQDLLDGGVTILERGDTVGCGDLGRYAIRSDSAAEAFLDVVRRTTDPHLAALQDHRIVASIAAATGGSVPLKQAADFLKIVGTTICRIVASSPRGSVYRDRSALFTRRTASGLWKTRVRCEITGVETDLLSRSLVLATGAHQPESRLRTELVAGTPLLPLYKDKLVQTGQIFTPEGAARFAERLRSVAHPKVVVVGGSTSAGAAARLMLHEMKDVAFDHGSVTLMHRRPLRIFYTTAADALAEGYTDFGPQDICPISGRVYRLAGFRLDTREMIMGALGIGGRPADHRLRLHRLDEADASNTPTESDTRRLLDEADLIVAALGYRPRALPVFSEDNRRIPLSAESDAMQPMVDGESRVLDQDGIPIDGIYGIGLASGLVPYGSLGGEESFRGQANSLWLWQHDIGLKIAKAVIQATSVAKSEDATSSGATAFETPIAPSLRASELTGAVVGNWPH